MTGTNSIAEASDTRTLLGAGVESTAATPSPTTPPPRNRLDDGWEEFAAAYLQKHPEISVAVPTWTEEIDFSAINDEVEGTIFSFSRTIRDVEIYGVGYVRASGAIELAEAGTVSIYLRNELRGEIRDVGKWALEVAEDLISAASLLRAEPRLLRRPAEVDAELQRLDI